MFQFGKESCRKENYKVELAEREKLPREKSLLNIYYRLLPFTEYVLSFRCSPRNILVEKTFKTKPGSKFSYDYYL